MPLFLPKIEAIGIDLSDRSIKIAQIKKKRKKLILKSISEKEIPAGFINDGIINKDKEKEIIEIIKEALLDFRGDKFTSRKAICSLPEENSFIKIIQIPRMKEEDIEEAIKWQIEPNFPVKLKDVYFDFEIVKEAQEEDISVCVAVILKDVVMSYLSLFEKAEIEPIVFEIESMSAIRALIADYIKKPIIVLDIGRCGTGFTVYSGNTILFTSHIEAGGQIFTDSIARNLKVDQKEAEEIKRKVGLRALQSRGISFSKIRFPITNLISDFSQRNIKRETQDKENTLSEKVFDAMILPLTDATEQIKKYIKYFGALREFKGIPGGDIEKIILCGGESRIIGLSEFLSDSLKVPVEPANPLKKIEVSKKISQSPSPYQFLSFTTAIGLAIRGVDMDYVEF